MKTMTFPIAKTLAIMAATPGEATCFAPDKAEVYIGLQCADG
jgi:hypothetical protein